MCKENWAHRMDEVSDITLRWARYAQLSYPNWEIDELRNEAFIIAMKLLQAGRYKPDKGALSTFLCNSIPMDVRHRYRRTFGERYITSDDGTTGCGRKYQRVEIVDSTYAEHAAVFDGNITVLEVSDNEKSEWCKARVAGFKASELRRRGMSYKEQRVEAEKLLESRHDDKQ